MAKRIISRTIAFGVSIVLLMGLITLNLFAEISFSDVELMSVPLFDSVQTSYINNANTGRYLRNSSSEISASSGELLDMLNTIKWQITPLDDGSYTIQSKSNSDLYLAGSTTATIDTVYLTELTDNSIPNYYKWNIYAGTGGCIIQNINTQKYLYDNGRTIASSSSLGTPGTSNYKMKIWRIADSVSYYGRNSATYSFIELPSDFAINTLYLFAGESKQPELANGYNNVLWGTADNFTFSEYDENYVTLDSLTGTFTASSSSLMQSMSITATHKVTNRTTTFTLVINPRAICVGVTNTEHDHASALNNISTVFTSCGYSSAPVYTGEFYADTVVSYLDSDENNIFISRSHGGKILNSSGTIIATQILLNNVDLDDASAITLQSNSSIYANKDLSNMKLVMFIGCWTASGNSNLPSVAVECGAQTAVGFTESIDCATANQWTIDFFELLSSGYSVYSACNILAQDPNYSSTYMTSYDIYGSQSTKIK